MKVPRPLIAALLVTLGVAVASTAALAWRGGGEHGERMIERVAERLELDDNQRAALDGFATELRETHELLHGDDELGERFRRLVTADTLDQGAALALIEQRTATVQSQAPALVATAAAFLDGLSAEQKADIERFLDTAGRHHRHD